MAVLVQASAPNAFRSRNSGKRLTNADRAISIRLKAARVATGLSQESAAEYLKVTFQQVQKYENGSNRISCGKLATLAKAYGVSIQWFFDGFFDGSESVPAGTTDDLGSLVLGLSSGADLARSFIKIRDVTKRRLLAEIAAQLAGDAR